MRRIWLAAMGAMLAAEPMSASADGHFFRRRFEPYPTETVLVEPTTYVVPSASYRVVDDRAYPTTYVVRGPRRTGLFRSLFPTRYERYEPVTYRYRSEPTTYAIPTRYVASSLTTLDFPAYESSTICCDPCASESVAPRSAPAEERVEPLDDVEPLAPTSSSEIRSTPRGSSVTVETRPTPRTEPGRRAAAVPPADPDTDRDPAKVIESEPGRVGTDPPLPADAPVTDPDPDPASSPPATPPADATNPPDVPRADADVPATKTDAQANPANLDVEQPVELPNLGVEPTALLRRSARKPTADALGAIVQGRVILAVDRSPDPGAVVLLSDPARKAPNRMITADALGRFALFAPDGTWEVSVLDLDGNRYYYGDFTVRDDVLRDLSGRTYRTLTLKR